MRPTPTPHLDLSSWSLHHTTRGNTCETSSPQSSPALGEDLTAMSRLVETAVSRAGTALLTADLPGADRDRRRPRDRRGARPRRARACCSRPAAAGGRRPARDRLRPADECELERMGDLARHVAKIARLRYPGRRCPRPPHHPAHARGGGHVVAAGPRSSATRDVEAAVERSSGTTTCSTSCTQQLRHVHGELDRSPRRRSTSPCWRRYYERFADHAVSIARRVVYVVTGDFADAAARTL